MTLPIMAGNLFQQCYSVVDSIIVGRVLGSSSLAAIGSTFAINILIMWFVCGSANGYAVVIARAFGAGDWKQLRRGVCRSFELSGIVTTTVCAVTLVFLKQFLRLMNTPAEIRGEAYRYIVIIIAGMLATVFYNSCAGTLRAMGDSRTPLYFLILSSVLNIFLDLLLIRTFGMGVEGAAAATVVSQVVSGVLCFTYMVRRYTLLRFAREDWKMDRETSFQMLSYGIPSGLNGTATAIGILILQMAINCYGTAIVAGYTAASKVETFSQVPLNALAMTMVNYEGQNLGAGNRENMKKGYFGCLLLGAAVSALCGAVLFFFGKAFISAFISAGTPEEVSAFACLFLRRIGFFLIPCSVLFITRSSLQGMGDRFAPVANGIIETVMRILFSLYLIRRPSVSLLCMVSPVTWTVGACALIGMLIRRWKIIDRQF